MSGIEYKMPDEIENVENFAKRPAEGHAAAQQAADSFAEINEKLDAILAALGNKEGAAQ